MAQILSTLVQNLYTRLNAGEDRTFSVRDPLSGKDIHVTRYFEDCIQNKGLPHESRYTKINSRFLPKIVFSAYYLLTGERYGYSPENINLSFKGYIDVDQLEEVVREEKVPVFRVLGSKARDYKLSSNGDHLLRVLSGSGGVRRVVFFPKTVDEQGKSLFQPHAEALKIVDLLYDHQCFVPLGASSGGSMGMQMIPSLNQVGELELIPVQELRQEVRRINNLRGQAQTLKMSRAELLGYVNRVVPPRKK